MATIYKGVDISAARRRNIVAKLKNKNFSEGYKSSLRKQLAKLDKARAKWRKEQPAQPAQPPAPDNSKVTTLAELKARAQSYGIDPGEFDTYFNNAINNPNIDATGLSNQVSSFFTKWQDLQSKVTDDFRNQYKAIYGTDINTKSIINNPVLDSWITQTGDFYNKANTLSATYKVFEQLSGVAGNWAGDLNGLNYTQFQELGSMFGSALPSQAEYARLQSEAGFKVGGLDKGEWEKRYEDFRKKRQGLYTGEEIKTGYQQTEEGFTASGLKTKQEY